MPKLRVDFIFFFFPPPHQEEDKTVFPGRHDDRLMGRDDTAVVLPVVLVRERIVSAGVIDNSDTKLLSDHFPVHFSFIHP